MRVEELLKELEKEYPNTVDSVGTAAQFEERKIQIRMIEHIRLIVTPPKKDR